MISLQIGPPIWFVRQLTKNSCSMKRRAERIKLVVLTPQTASIKQKMVSASSKDALKKKLDDIQVYCIPYTRSTVRVGTDFRTIYVIYEA